MSRRLFTVIFFIVVFGCLALAIGGVVIATHQTPSKVLAAFNPPTATATVTMAPTATPKPTQTPDASILAPDCDYPVYVELDGFRFARKDWTEVNHVKPIMTDDETEIRVSGYGLHLQITADQTLFFDEDVNDGWIYEKVVEYKIGESNAKYGPLFFLTCNGRIYFADRSNANAN